MSTFPSGLTGCPDLQAELVNYFNTCTENGILFESMPAYDFLMSPLNKQGVTDLGQAVNPMNGKLRDVQLRYDQRISESEVEEVNSCDDDCTATTERGDGIAVYTLDPCNRLVVEEKFNAKDWTAACRSNPDIVLGKIARMMDAVVRKTATERTIDMTATYGNWSQVVTQSGLTVTNDELVVNTLKASSTDYNAGALASVSAAFKYSEYCAQPVIFSGGLWDMYMRAMQVGCCANDGMDLAKTLATYGMASMFDRRIQNALGVDKALTVMPGALQIVFYNSYAGIEEVADALGIGVGRNYVTGVLIHPRTGTPVNVLMKDDCGMIHVIMHTVSQVFAMPTDMFPAGDYMEGVTYVNKIDISNV